MLSQETIDDLHEFAEKLLAEQEEELARKKNLIVNKKESSLLTSRLDSSDNYPVTPSYRLQSSYVAKSN